MAHQWTSLNFRSSVPQLARGRLDERSLGNEVSTTTRVPPLRLMGGYFKFARGWLFCISDTFTLGVSEDLRESINEEPWTRFSCLRAEINVLWPTLYARLSPHGVWSTPAPNSAEVHPSADTLLSIYQTLNVYATNLE